MDGTSQAFLDAILDTAVEGIIVIDDRGNIAIFNGAAQRMFGYAPSEVIGRNVSILMPEPFRSGHDQYISNYLNTKEAKIIGIGREVTGLRRDGSTFPMELAVSEVRAENRRMFTGLVKDLTERKNLEKEVLEVSEREQRRIGQDLHDGVCQELAGIAFKVQSMQRVENLKGNERAADLVEIVTLLQSAIRRARRLSHGLFPVDPAPNGLRVALGQLAEQTADVSASKCTFRCTQSVEVYDPSAATHLYRIAHEAVRNAVRHGKANQILISLGVKKGILKMGISDDGTGQSNDGRFRTDMVLRYIRHRANVLGAKLHVQFVEKRGLRVVCEFVQQPI